MKEGASFNECRNTILVTGRFPSRRLRKTWNEVIRSDLKETKVIKADKTDKNNWKTFLRNCPTQENIENKH